MHLSRRQIQEFLRDWLGIELSTSPTSATRPRFYPIYGIFST
jgi:hypothetical protein